jgi:hypothetical protein
MRLLFRPLGVWPRQLTTHPDRSPFTTGWSSTVDLLEREINHLILRSKPEVLIQIDAPEGAMRMDGGLRADARAKFHGVMISFESKYGPKSFTCDRYSAPNWANRGEQPWKDNARAIALGLEALRKLDRYGITDSGQQYEGWKALGSGIPMPAAQMTVEDAARFIAVHSSAIDIKTDAWRILLGDPDLVKARYKDAAWKLHPDSDTGDAALFKQLGEARDLLLREVRV